MANFFQNKKKETFWIILICCVLLIYFLLAFRSPYSLRTLIPNLEPYPDTFYYAVPAWNFVQGKGFVLGDGVKTAFWSTPPVYTLYLVPFFALFGDIRSYYYANLFLGFVSLFLYLRILSKLFNSEILVLTGGVVFASLRYLYLMPELLMAENMTVFLVIFALYRVVVFEKKFDLVIVILAWLILLTKFSNLPIFLCFLLFESMLVLKNISSKNILNFIVLMIFGVGYLLFTGIVAKQVNMMSSEVGFSGNYFLRNLTFYVNSLLGFDTKYLWFNSPAWSFGIGVLGILGIIFSYIKRKVFYVFISCLVFVCISFMSFFYFPDFRYIVVLSPIWIIFVVYALSVSRFKIFAIVLFLSHVGSSMLMWRSQIGLNFRHTQSPWNYIAVKEVSEYLNKEDNCVIFSFLPRMMFYLYNTSKCSYEPILSDGRFDFEVNPEARIGKFLVSNKKVFVMEAYAGNWPESVSWGMLDKLKLKYKFAKTKEACLGACNIYKVSDDS